MGFKLGRHSKAELKGVHPDLVAVVKRAIEISEQDFTVHDGLRSKAEQREYVDRGVSWTMKSKHLKQKATGFGHAVDLVPYINGKLRWEWPAIHLIASAMRQAAKELGVKIRWGGCWERLDNSTLNTEIMVEEYTARKRRQGKRPSLDGPHYELM